MHWALKVVDCLDEDEMLDGLIELEDENMLRMLRMQHMQHSQKYEFFPPYEWLWPDPVFAQLTPVTLSSQPATDNNYGPRSYTHSQPPNQLVQTMVSSAEMQLCSSDESVSDSEQLVTSSSSTPSPASSNSEYAPGDAPGDAETDKSVTSHYQAAQPRRRQRRLCKFLLDTLENEIFCPSIIAWVDRETGVFRFVDPGSVARLWGESRRRKNMSYEHLSRAMRYYYASGTMKRVAGQGRLVYQFLEPCATINKRSQKQRRSRTQTTGADS